MSRCSCRSHGGFLTDRGYAEVAQRALEGLEGDAMAPVQYLDSRVSVSGLELERDLYLEVSDEYLDQQDRRFHHGT